MFNEDHPQICKPQFVNTDKIVSQPRPLFRTTGSGGRYYYNVNPDGSVHRYTSVTTIINQVFPKSEILIKWIAEHGLRQAEFLRDKAAHYGTLMHICLSQYLMDGFFEFETLPARIQTYVWDNNIDFDTSIWRYNLERDILCFDLFCFDYQVKPLAIAIMLSSDELGIAGEIDFVLQLTMGTGVNGKVKKSDIKYDDLNNLIIDKRRVVNGIIDFKSGRHGFFKQNEAQLKFYEKLWNANFPYIPVTHVFNWSPDNWSNIPSYNFKDQSNSPEEKKLNDYLNIFNTDFDANKTLSYTKISGKIELGSDNSKALLIESFEDRARKFVGWSGKETKSKSISSQVEKALVTAVEEPTIPIEFPPNAPAPIDPINKILSLTNI